jgi:hypothetical protein
MEYKIRSVFSCNSQSAGKIPPALVEEDIIRIKCPVDFRKSYIVNKPSQFITPSTNVCMENFRAVLRSSGCI